MSFLSVTKIAIGEPSLISVVPCSINCFAIKPSSTVSNGTTALSVSI